MARCAAHAAAAHAGEQKRVFRQLAHTSGVDAPQAAQAERGEADDDMARITMGGQRGDCELVRARARDFFLEVSSPPPPAPASYAFNKLFICLPRSCVCSASVGTFQRGPGAFTFDALPHFELPGAADAAAAAAAAPT
jgi:hypothetical protein